MYRWMDRWMNRWMDRRDVSNIIIINTTIHTFIHIFILTYIHEPICPSIYPSIHSYMHPSFHLSMHTSIHPRIHQCIHPYMDVCSLHIRQLFDALLHPQTDGMRHLNRCEARQQQIHFHVVSGPGVVGDHPIHTQQQRLTTITTTNTTLILDITLHDQLLDHLDELWRCAVPHYLFHLVTHDVQPAVDDDQRD